VDSGVVPIAGFQLAPQHFGIMKPVRSHEIKRLVPKIILPVQRDDCPKQEQQYPLQTTGLYQRHHVYRIITEAAPVWKAP
jgi:hypothetical protein